MSRLNLPDEHQEIRDAIRSLCSQFPDGYFRKDAALASDARYASNALRTVHRDALRARGVV